MKRLLNLFMVLCLSIIGGSVLASTAGVSFGVGALGVGALSFIPQPKQVLFVGVQKEIWLNEIVANLFKDNDFLNYAVNEDQYVIQGKVVHIPQAASPSKVERNRKTLPASITRRKDVDVVYVLDEYTTNPRLIESADKVELSYDKMSSVIEEDQAALTEQVAEWMLYHWRPEVAEQILRTTGESVPAHVVNATGNRKRLTLADVRAAKVKLDKQQISKADRHALIDTDMMDQLSKDLQITSARDYSVMYDAVTGRIKNLEGFIIHERSTVLAADNASTPVVLSPEDATVASSNGVSLFWQRQAVSRAMGTKEMFDSLSNPQYFGDIYSFLLRMGGRKRRADNKGVIGIIQAAA